MIRQAHGAGRENANILVVDDSANDDDIKNGEALTGQRGSMLSSLFRESGLKWQETYRTLLYKEKLIYAGKNKKKLREALKEADSHVDPKTYAELLFKEILEVNPQIVVPLGELSFQLLTNERHITKFRGSILPIIPEIAAETTKFIRVIPTLSPNHIYADWASKTYVSLDLGRIKANQGINEPIKEKHNIWVCTSVDAFRNYVNRSYPHSSLLTFDIETFVGIPTCISFCFDGKEAISVPLFEEKVDRANGMLMLSEVARLLASPIPKVNQNIKYDWIILERFGFKINNIVGDTMLRASLIYPELPKGLDFLTSIYTEVGYYKDEGKEYDSRIHDKSRLYLYNAKDALVTYQVYEAQQEDLKELDLETFDKEKMTPWLHMYKKIDERGITINFDTQSFLIAKYQSLMEMNAAEFESITNEKINLDSPTQVGKVVYEVLKYPVRYKTSELGKRSYNTEEEMLEELLVLFGDYNKHGEAGKQALRCIIAHRKFTKILQYITIPVHPDGRIRTSSKLHGTKNGRTSGGKTADYILDFNERRRIKRNKQNKLPNYGGSFQTIPKHGFQIGGKSYGKDIRSMYIPTKGYQFIEGDLSQAEARVDAVLAQDWDFLPKFDIAPGAHAITASWLYNVDPFEIKRLAKVEGNDEMYHLGKTVRHAAERNMGEKTLALMTHKDLPTCKLLLERFHEQQPKIRGIFHREVFEFVTHSMKLVAPNGRTRQFFGRKDNNLYNDAISTIPQMVVSDQTKDSMLRTERDGEHLDFHYVYEGHDAAMAEVRIGQEEEYMRIFKRHMETPINFENCSLSRNFDLVIPAELMIGAENWMEMKEVKI